MQSIAPAGSVIVQDGFVASAPLTMASLGQGIANGGCEQQGQQWVLRRLLADRSTPPPGSTAQPVGSVHEPGAHSAAPLRQTNSGPQPPFRKLSIGQRHSCNRDKR
jgi:hypothetical protein